MGRNRGWLLLGVAALGVSVLFLAAYGAASAPLPEGFPPPTSDGQLEVKQYPSYRAATVHITGPLAEAPSRGFAPLYRHINRNQIAMTAPVETRYPLGTLQSNTLVMGEATVSFLYRSLDIEPETTDADVEIEEVPAMIVVSLGQRGSYDYDSYMQGLERIQDWLQQHPQWSVAGAPRRLFYDAPFIPNYLKRSEIQIPIRGGKPNGPQN